MYTCLFISENICMLLRIAVVKELEEEEEEAEEKEADWEKKEEEED